jgi:hypothetical protein
MTAAITTFEIGQSVHLLPDTYIRTAGTEIYTVLRCNESDSSNPSYVIRSEVDSRQRRALHDRLRPATPTFQDRRTA